MAFPCRHGVSYVFLSFAVGLLYKQARNLTCFAGLTNDESVRTKITATASGSGKKYSRKNPYKEAPTEAYLMQNLETLGYESKEGEYVPGCNIWKGENVDPSIANQLMLLKEDLKVYRQHLVAFKAPFDDVRKHLEEENVCERLSLSNTTNLEQMFHGQLSQGPAG